MQIHSGGFFYLVLVWLAMMALIFSLVSTFKSFSTLIFQLFVWSIVVTVEGELVRWLCWMMRKLELLLGRGD